MQERNDRPKSERKFRSMTLATIALDHIAAAYRPRRHASEHLARTTDATPNAARNWLRGLNAPHAEHIGALIERDPEFRAKVRAWLDSLP